jgi:hypothetical protein
MEWRINKMKSIVAGEYVRLKKRWHSENYTS